MGVGLFELVPETHDKYVRYRLQEDSFCIEDN